jgi:hypothetical protein
MAGVTALRRIGSPSASPLLTAIVSAHNEAGSIAATIRSLRRRSRVPDRLDPSPIQVIPGHLSSAERGAHPDKRCPSLVVQPKQK